MDKKFKRGITITFIATFICMIGLLGSIIVAPNNSFLIVTFAILFVICVIVEFVYCLIIVRRYWAKHKNDFD